MRRDTDLRIAIVPLVAVLVLGVAGCSPVHYGSYPDGLTGFPDRTISPEEAVRAAEPYLDQSFALCRAARGSKWPDGEPHIRVQLQGKYYKVLKDNYPSMYSGHGFNHAVKVNADTGEVIPPK